MRPSSDTSAADAGMGVVCPMQKEDEMSDDKSRRGAADRSRISLTEDYEVGYWTEALGVAERDLRRIVDSVGDRADAVRTAIGKPA